MHIGMFLVLAGALVVSISEGRVAHSSPMVRRSGSHIPLYRNLQVTKRQILERTSSHEQNTPEATPTTPSGSETNHQEYRRQYVKTSALNQKVHFYLSQCYNGLQQRVVNVKSICTGPINAANAESIAWKLLAELQAILALCLTCAQAVRGCPNEPAPSGTAGSGQNPSIYDISQMMYQIIVSLKTCFQTVNTTCTQYRVIQNICNDTLRQITAALSNCVSTSGSVVVGVLPGLNQIMGGQNLSGFFGSIGYGWSQVSNILLNI